MDNVLGVEVVHPLGSLPRDLDHVQQLELRLVDVQMLQKKRWSLSVSYVSSLCETENVEELTWST